MTTKAKAPTTVGTVYPPETLFFRVDAATAKDKETGETWECTINVGGSQPIIRAPDGRWWSITWQQLIELARADLAAVGQKGKA